MKAKVIVLKKNERKALAGIVNAILSANEMMERAGRILAERRPEMWDKLNGMYPKDKEATRTFNYENFELSYFVPTTKQEKYKALKEKAINDKDFETAAKWRDLEKTEKDKRE